jgi:hypothetical protein
VSPLPGQYTGYIHPSYTECHWSAIKWIHETSVTDHRSGNWEIITSYGIMDAIHTDVWRHQTAWKCVYLVHIKMLQSTNQNSLRTLLIVVRCVFSSACTDRWAHRGRGRAAYIRAYISLQTVTVIYQRGRQWACTVSLSGTCAPIDDDPSCER